MTERNVGLEYFEKKAREGKAPLQKLYPKFLAGMARVCDMGDKKHADTHWTLGLPWSAVVGAIKRHVAEFESGKITDKESSENHLLHAAVGLMFLHYYCEHPEKYNKNNDLIFWEPKEEIQCNHVWIYEIRNGDSKVICNMCGEAHPLAVKTWQKAGL